MHACKRIAGLVCWLSLAPGSLAAAAHLTGMPHERLQGLAASAAVFHSPALCYGAGADGMTATAPLLTTPTRVHTGPAGIVVLHGSHPTRKPLQPYTCIPPWLLQPDGHVLPMPV